MFWAIEQFLTRDKRAVEEYAKSLEEQARTHGVVQIGDTHFAVTAIPCPYAAPGASAPAAKPPKMPGSQT